MSNLKTSPLEIRRQHFKVSFRGADTEEVRAFLEIVASDFEKTLQENAMMEETVRHQSERLDEYRQLEQFLRNSLVTAERNATESRDASEREANRVLEEASLRAERILNDARERLQTYISEIEDLRAKKEVFVRRFRMMLEEQAAMLEERGHEGLDLDVLERRSARLAEQIEATERGRGTEAMDRPRALEPNERPRNPDVVTARMLEMADRLRAGEPRETKGVATQLNLPTAPTAPRESSFGSSSREDSRPRVPVRRSELVVESTPPRAPADPASDQAPVKGLGRFFRRNEAVLPIRNTRPEGDDGRGEGQVNALQQRRDGYVEISAQDEDGPGA